MRFFFLIFISLFVLVAFTQTSFARIVTPEYNQVKETGSESLPSLDPAMRIECDDKNIMTVVSDFRSNLPVANAQAYLFNTNYGYNFLYRNSTDESGRVSIHALGNLNFLTALFIMRIDAPGYRTKEIEFTFSRCFDSSESEPNPAPTTPTPEPTPTPQVEPTPVPQPTPIINPPTPSATNSSTRPATQPASPCPLPLGLIILPLIYSICESKKTLSAR
ncbi:hypothetical protein HY990_06345 [Candidatus Micrarchaeota archaeon]|nr:hypothetical protein [Candidatus Micrarchaeota archaeon]